MRARALIAFILTLFFSGQARAADELNISYVKAPFNLQLIVMKNKGFLDRELAPLGARPRWHEMGTGSMQARALASGDLDVAGVINSTSVQIAASEGAPIKLFAGVARPAPLFIIAAANGGPASLRDLKGKTVAGPKGSVLHQLLAAALDREGLNEKDVKLVNMDVPRSLAALESGRVDAALLAGAAAVKAAANGAVKLADAEGLVTPKLGMAVSEKFARERPDLLKAALAAHDKSWEWIAANPEEAIAIGAKEQGVGIPTAKKLFEDSRFCQRLDESDIASMEEDQEFLARQGMIRRGIEPRSLLLDPASL